jgi:hypothetical protein
MRSVAWLLGDSEQSFAHGRGFDRIERLGVTAVAHISISCGPTPRHRRFGAYDGGRDVRFARNDVRAEALFATSLTSAKISRRFREKWLFYCAGFVCDRCRRTNSGHSSVQLLATPRCDRPTTDVVVFQMQSRRRCHVREMGREEGHVRAECQSSWHRRPSGAAHWLGPPAQTERRQQMPLDFARLGTY